VLSRTRSGGGASPGEAHRHVLDPCNQVRLEPLDCARQLDMLDPTEQIRQHQAQFQPRQMSAGTEMLTLAKGDVFVRPPRDIEAVRIFE
jgi:hypothetical protein